MGMRAKRGFNASQHMLCDPEPALRRAIRFKPNTRIFGEKLASFKLSFVALCFTDSRLSVSLGRVI